jgi:hypothetical protein
MVALVVVATARQHCKQAVLVTRHLQLHHKATTAAAETQMTVVAAAALVP